MARPYIPSVLRSEVIERAQRQTPEGRATARLLHFNDPTRVYQRADLITAGKFGPKS